jgi:hypothetical protein
MALGAIPVTLARVGIGVLAMANLPVLHTVAHHGLILLIRMLN